ncbi:MAG: hypothetical protein ACE5L6_00960 [Candidatus Bathyarchaeia archaeon]
MSGEPANKKQHPLSLLSVAMALCAGLYAVGSYLTAYIPSPWGFGQFRPAVFIPAFFAIIFGPMPAGIGAALGTLIADSVKHGYLYPGSLIAAVPGNFIGFYLFGYIVKKKFTWKRFILASNITLTVANLIVAFLYVFCFKLLYASALEFNPSTLTFLSIGLTIWWFITMLPFVLVITPPLIRAVAVAVPSVVPEHVRTHSLKQELPKVTFSLAMLIPGLIMVLMGLATSYTAVGEYIFTTFGEVTHVLIQTMFYLSGAVLSVLGALFYVKRFI